MSRIPSLAAMFIIGFAARSLTRKHRAVGPHRWRRRSGRRHRAWQGEVPGPFRSSLERWHQEAHAAD